MGSGISLGLGLGLCHASPGGALSLPAGMAAWYDFSDLTTLFQDTGRTTPVTADGQSILGVTDKSGNGNHITQAAGPLYKAAIQNGKSVGRFNGTSNFLANAGYAFPGGNITAYAAVNIVAATSFGMVFSIASAEELRQNGVTGQPQMIYHGATMVSWGAALVGSWHVQTGYYDGANVGVNVDNGTAVSAGVGADAAQTGIAVGARIGGANFAQIDLMALAIYHTFHNAAQQAQACAFLKALAGTP